MDDFTESVLRVCNNSIHEANDLASSILIEGKRDYERVLSTIEPMDEGAVIDNSGQNKIPRKSDICLKGEVDAESLETNISQIDISDEIKRFSS